MRRSERQVPRGPDTGEEPRLLEPLAPKPPVGLTCRADVGGAVSVSSGAFSSHVAPQRSGHEGAARGASGVQAGGGGEI